MTMQTLFGYLCLGGGPQLDFSSHFEPDLSRDGDDDESDWKIYDGQPVGPGRGQWKMATELKSTILSIPARDKQLQVFCSPYSLSTLAPKLAQLDSEPGPNYKTKLESAINGSHMIGAVNTISTEHHHTLTLFSTDRDWPLQLIGLFDTQHKTTYLFWSTEPDRIMKVLDAHPLRFLIYRFPISRLVFFHTSALCSHWRHWMRKSEFSALLPFNALERRLFN